jgi:hypothetical protein
MAAANYILAIYQKVFALLEAHAPTAAALKAGNEVREDRGKLNPRGTAAKQPADFPRIVLRHTGEEDTGFTEDPTFAAMESDIVTSGDGWREKVTLTYEVKAIHDSLNLTSASLFELEAKTAIRKGGPRFGLDYVVGWTTSSKSVETDQDQDAPGRMRRVTTITLSVTCEFEGSELIT